LIDDNNGASSQDSRGNRNALSGKEKRMANVIALNIMRVVCTRNIRYCKNIMGSNPARTFIINNIMRLNIGFV